MQKDILTEYTKNPKDFEDSLEPKEMNMLLDYIDEVTGEPKPEEIVYEHDKAHPNFKKLVDMT